MSDFTKLAVWRRAIRFAEEAHRADFRPTEVYGLAGQLRRAAVSVAANIAEGCSRSSRREFRRFLEIALGSLFEARTLLEICRRAAQLPSSDTQKLPRSSSKPPSEN